MPIVEEFAINTIDVVRNPRRPSKANRGSVAITWRRIARLINPSPRRDDGFRHPSKFAFVQTLVFIAVGFAVVVSIIQLVEAALR